MRRAIASPAHSRTNWNDLVHNFILPEYGQQVSRRDDSFSRKFLLKKHFTARPRRVKKQAPFGERSLEAVCANESRSASVARRARYSLEISMRLFSDGASALRGRVMVSTPFLWAALTASASTSLGRVSTRWNVP